MIKRFIGMLSLVLLGFTASAQYNTELLSGLPATVASGATSNLTSNLDVRKQANTALMFKFANGGTNTQNVTLTFTQSVDGSTYADAPTFTWVVAAQGNTNSYAVSTNFATTGYGYLRLKSIANGSGDTITVTSIAYSLKKSD